MDLIDRLRELSARIPQRLEHLRTEEATKNALVMPFLNALGYNVFDPTVVVPEYVADVGTKKGEKVDYAILDPEGKPIILIECKAAGTDLDQVHASQLYRYFSVTEARFGILTNGIEYRFFSDLDAQNKMDSRPFLEFSMLEVTAGLAAEVKRFAKDVFDLEDILSTANDLKFTRGIKKSLEEEWQAPSEDLVRLLTSRVFPGRFTQSIREQFTVLTKKALAEFLKERVDERLKSALEGNASKAAEAAEEPAEEASDIVTTEEELEAFYAVKALLRGTVDVSRVTIRDRKHYCAVLLDDTNRKPICRFYFDRDPKQVSLFDEKKEEVRHPIQSLDDLLGHAEHLRATVARYLVPDALKGEAES